MNPFNNEKSPNLTLVPEVSPSDLATKITSLGDELVILSAKLRVSQNESEKKEIEAAMLKVKSDLKPLLDAEDKRRSEKYDLKGSEDFKWDATYRGGNNRAAQ